MQRLAVAARNPKRKFGAGWFTRTKRLSSMEAETEKREERIKAKRQSTEQNGECDLKGDAFKVAPK